MNKEPTIPSPTQLSYIAALRGVTPRKSKESFVYVDLNCVDPDYFICLAASNPEGSFIGLNSTLQQSLKNNALAMSSNVDNVKFIGTPAQNLQSAIDTGEVTLPRADYIHFDSRFVVYSESDKKAIASLVQKHLTPNGLYHYVYNAYQAMDGALGFLLSECSSQFSGTQHAEFLSDLKVLGGKFLKQNPQIAELLQNAIASNDPTQLLSVYKNRPSSCATLETIITLGQHDMAFVGSGCLPLNYIDLSVPAEAHNLLLTCTENPLYEVIKDYATNTVVRSDIWVRTPVEMSDDNGVLFSQFSFGISHPERSLPTTVRTESGSINLANPVYSGIIKLLSLTPATIGDFLSHPLGKGFSGIEVLQAMQMLVALDIVTCIRGTEDTAFQASMESPRMAGRYNRAVANSVVEKENVLLASTVLGKPTTLTIRELLVMQALDRAGLSNSVSALMPELERLANDMGPVASLPTNLTPEQAQSMVRDIVGNSMVHWYAYGLLQAA